MKKPSQNRENRAKPVWTGFYPKNRTEPKPVSLTRFQFGFGFFKKKNRLDYFFFDKNWTESKIITSTLRAW